MLPGSEDAPSRALWPQVKQQHSETDLATATFDYGTFLRDLRETNNRTRLKANLKLQR